MFLIEIIDERFKKKKKMFNDTLQKSRNVPKSAIGCFKTFSDPESIS